MSENKFSNLQVYVLTNALKKGGTLTRERIFIEFYKQPTTKSLSASTSRSLKSLKERGFVNIDRLGVITLTDMGREIALKLNEIVEKEDRKLTVVNTEPEKLTGSVDKITAEPEKEIGDEYHYTFRFTVNETMPGSDINIESRRIQKREIQVGATASSFDIALRKAEQYVRTASVDGEYSGPVPFSGSGGLAIVRKKR